MAEKSRKTVFLSYSIKDLGLVRKLISALDPLVTQGLISLEMDDRASAGMVSREEVVQRMSASDLIVLLLSADYLASDYCWGFEMKSAFDGYRAGRSHLVPVILRPCDWRSTPLAELQVFPEDGKPLSQWSHAEDAFSDLLSGIRDILSRTPSSHSLPEDNLGRTAVFIHPGVWNIPYSRDPAFVGRRDEFLQADEALQRVQNFKPVIITGLAGVGKTALAVEYAYRNAHRYSAVWWVRAHQKEVFGEDLASLASALGLVPKDQVERRQAVELAKDWLARNRGWLLIYDDLQDPHLLESLPRPLTGTVLGTSRVLSWRGGVDILSLLPLSAADSEVLAASLGVKGQSLDRVLGEVLGGHPLAIRLAAASLLQRRLDQMEGPREWADEHRDVFRSFAGEKTHKTQETAPVASLLDALIGNATRGSAARKMILNISSFLAGVPMPSDAFCASMLMAPKSAHSSLSAESLEEAVAQLVEGNIIERTGGALVFHGLIQEFIRSRLPKQERGRWLETAVTVLVSAFPDHPSDEKAFDLCSKLLPHAYAVLSHSESLNAGSAASVLLLLKVGNYLTSRAEFANAQRSFTGALELAHRINLTGTMTEALVYQGLGTVCEQLLDLQSASNNYRRGLAIAESTGADPDATIGFLSMLARVSHARGDLAESANLLERALRLAADHFELDDRLRARLLAQWSDTLRSRGQLANARAALEEAIRILKQPGEDSDEVLAYSNFLGVVLDDMGDVQAARHCFEQLVEQARKHGDRILLTKVLNNLGATYRASGSLAQAISCYREALAINEAIGNGEPESMGLTLKNLGEAYLQGSRFDEAKIFLERALHMLEGSYGPAHNVCRNVSRELESVSARQH